MIVFLTLSTPLSMPSDLHTLPFDSLPHKGKEIAPLKQKNLTVKMFFLTSSAVRLSFLTPIPDAVKGALLLAPYTFPVRLKILYFASPDHSGFAFVVIDIFSMGKD